MNIPDLLGEGEHEILHLSKRMELDGNIYDREISYLSDHRIYHRFAKNGDWGSGWAYWKIWRTLDEIYQAIDLRRQWEWQVELHPAYIRRLK